MFGGGSPLSVAVPAGLYVVIGQMTLQDLDGDAQDASCTLQGQTLVLTRVSAGASDVVPITGIAVLGSPGVITISCAGFRINPISTRLTVIKVDSIN